MTTTAMLAGLMLVGLMVTGGNATAGTKDEQPPYTVVTAENDFEIRDYGATVMAQFTMRGTYRQAVSRGYIELEQYFLGKNTVPEPIKITIPQMVRDDLAGGWTTIFVLPNGYRVERAPRPLDERIRVVEYPPRRIAAIRFPGKLDEFVMREQADKLAAWLATKGIAHKGDFTLASYDAPWKPSKWRKNEVIVTLR